MEDIIKILDVNITTLPEMNILEKIEKYIKRSNIKYQISKIEPQKPLLIYTPNPEIIMYAKSHPWFKEIVNKGQINIPDGAGVVWAARKKGYPIERRISGADLAYNLVKLGDKENVTIGLIGGKAKIALKSLECLKEVMPRLNGWVEEGPEIRIRNQESGIMDYANNWSFDKFVSTVKERDTKILLVAFGFPKQELFIDKISNKLEDIVIMSVGGTFDYWSGSLKRAPVWMQKNNIEWLYRLIKQPKRIKRHINGSKFFIYSYINN